MNTSTNWDIKFSGALALAREKVRLRKRSRLSIGWATLRSIHRKPSAASIATPSSMPVAMLKPPCCELLTKRSREAREIKDVSAPPMSIVPGCPFQRGAYCQTNGDADGVNAQPLAQLCRREGCGDNRHGYGHHHAGSESLDGPEGDEPINRGEKIGKAAERRGDDEGGKPCQVHPSAAEDITEPTVI